MYVYTYDLEVWIHPTGGQCMCMCGWRRERGQRLWLVEDVERLWFFVAVSNFPRYRELETPGKRPRTSNYLILVCNLFVTPHYDMVTPRRLLSPTNHLILVWLRRRKPEARAKRMAGAVRVH